MLQLICAVIFYPTLINAKDELDNIIVNKNIELERLIEIANNDIAYRVDLTNNNLLPTDEGLSKQIARLNNPLITNVNPIATQYLDIGVIQREYEVTFIGPILNAIESIQAIYPLTKVEHIEWAEQGKMRILVYTEDK